MNSKKEDFLLHYNTLHTDELVEIKNNGTLTKAALVAIDEVLEKRRITESDKIEDSNVKNSSLKNKVLPIIFLIIFFLFYKMIPRLIDAHFKPNHLAHVSQSTQPFLKECSSVA